MNKVILALNEIKLVGITARTSNLLESNYSTSKIPSTIKKFLYNKLQDSIPDRKKPGTLFTVYTNYESDVNGYYTYFLGEEVNSFENVKNSFETLIIPSQNYVKFTSDHGKMPKVA